MCACGVCVLGEGEGREEQWLTIGEHDFQSFRPEHALVSLVLKVQLNSESIQ